MRSAITSAIAYAILVFAVGFIAGMFRVLFVVPQIGETVAVLIELPLMIAASYLFASWCVRRWQVPGDILPRVSMGVVAFATLMIFETFVSLAMFGNTPSQHFARYLRPQEWLGLSGQLVFAAMPVLINVARDGTGLE